MSYEPVIVKLTPDDLKLVEKKAQIQEGLYGHDRGYFTLGRNDSSHKIGFEGEVAFVRWATDTLGLIPGESVGLNDYGAKYDAYLVIDGQKHFVHIKTGRWTKWPTPNYFFGVHYGQEIEKSNAPVILMSFLRDDNTRIKIEGFLSDEKLAKCQVIKRGQIFPGMSYPSRTDNWLTRIGDYESINNLVKFLREGR